MFQRIIAIYKTKEKYGRLTFNSDFQFAATRKEPQCPYRSINILFSDRFAEGFAQLENGSELDTVEVANN